MAADGPSRLLIRIYQLKGGARNSQAKHSPHPGLSLRLSSSLGLASTSPLACFNL
jgi:hypothetical protein